MTLILLIINLALIALEVFTASTFFSWIAVGFLCASLASLLTSSVIVLAIIGVATTLISVALLKAKYMELVLPAEGNKTAAITETEGIKESTILRVEEEKNLTFSRGS